MDELLALMEDDVEGSSSIPPPDKDDDDDYFFMPEESVNPENCTSNCDPSPPPFLYSRKKDEKTKRTVTSPTSIVSLSARSNFEKSPRGANVATVGVDEKLGIRMINRNISSLDLLDLITSTSPYVSPAQLCAMSLQAQCRMLVDPPSIVDRATVQGRTYLVTVGIVFENSGTKTSSKGGAFCILTIGSNLQTGPCVSVFLFGSAYTKFCRSCQAGHVVAISNPKLLPAREEQGRQDMSVTLSVFDQSQIVLVAKARDYGVCQGTTRGKQANGNWSNAAGTCKNYVDKRVGDYCAFHIKQQKQKQSNSAHLANCSQMRGAGGITAKSGGGFKLIQEHKAQKMQQTMQPRNNRTGNRFQGSVAPGIVANHRTPVTTVNTSNTVVNRFLAHSSMGKIAIQSTNPPRSSGGSLKTVNPYLAKVPKMTSTFDDTNIINHTRPPERGIASSIPVHMKKQDQFHNDSIRNRSTDNPIKHMVSIDSSTEKRRINSTNERSVNNDTGDWMKEAVAKRTPVPQSLTKVVPGDGRQRIRKVSTVGGGFDGSVVVPKPSLLFTNHAVKTYGTAMSIPAHSLLEEDDTDKIKEKQALLAEKLREKKIGRSAEHGSCPPAVNLASNSKKTKKPASSGNLFLDSIHVDNVEAVLAAKSQFASEAAAEDYAKNRSRVVELEKLETQKNKRKGPNQEKENQKIICEWVCRTCPNAPRFAMRPTQCISNGHEVKRCRLLRQSKTKEDERTQLNNQAPEHGGIILGRGLEWSSSRFN